MQTNEEYGYVYAIGDEGCVKLGISATDAKRRLNTMQSGNPEKIGLIGQAYVPGYKEMEKQLHKEWKNKGRWIRGEWYRLSVLEAKNVIKKLDGETTSFEGIGDPTEVREREWMSDRGFPGGSFDLDDIVRLVPCYFNLSPRALHHSEHRDKCFALNNVSVPDGGLFDHERSLVDVAGNLVGWITQPYDTNLERASQWINCLDEAADKFGLMTVYDLNSGSPHNECTRAFSVFRDPSARRSSTAKDNKPPFLAWWYQQWNRTPADSISKSANAYGCHWDHVKPSPDGYNAWEMFETICSIEHYGDRRLVSRAYREFVNVVGRENISFSKPGVA